MCERSGRILLIIPGGREPRTENREPRTKGLEAFVIHHLSLVTRHSSLGCNRRNQPMTKPMQCSYLLRLWRNHAGAPMRATLIAVGCPDKPRHFANLDELFAFLKG